MKSKRIILKRHVWRDRKQVIVQASHKTDTKEQKTTSSAKTTMNGKNSRRPYILGIRHDGEKIGTTNKDRYRGAVVTAKNLNSLY